MSLGPSTLGANTTTSSLWPPSDAMGQEGAQVLYPHQGVVENRALILDDDRPLAMARRAFGPADEERARVAGSSLRRARSVAVPVGTRCGDESDARRHVLSELG